MSQGLLTYSAAGLDDELLWQERSGTTDAVGNLVLNFGQGNGQQIAAIKAFSVATAPATVGFQYQGGVALPNPQFPMQAPAPSVQDQDPIAIGLGLDPAQVLLVNLANGGNAQDWRVSVLFRRCPPRCGNNSKPRC